MVEIEISNNQEAVEISPQLIGSLSDLAVRICALLGINHKTISVAFITKPEIAELNRQYRSKDKATDVLSFPLSGPMDGDPVLGEILISAEVAAEQAALYGNSLEGELNFLLLHGMLHLAGWDHDDDHRGPMREKEKELFRELGLGQLKLKIERP